MSKDRPQPLSTEQRIENARLEALNLTLCLSHMVGQYCERSKENGWIPPRSIKWDGNSSYGKKMVFLVDGQEIHGHFESEEEFGKIVKNHKETVYRPYNPKADADWFDLIPTDYSSVWVSKQCQQMDNGRFALAGRTEGEEFVVDIFPDKKMQISIILLGLNEIQSDIVASIKASNMIS
jgi:hypothetical protein